MHGPKDTEPTDLETYEPRGARSTGEPLSEMGTYEAFGARDADGDEDPNCN